VVPVLAPIFKVVAAPAKFKVVELVLNRLVVDWVVVISPPFTAKSPVATRSLLTVVVPDPAAIETVVAAPPMFKVVALVLKILAEEAVVEIVPPLTAILLPKVAFPEPRKEKEGLVTALPKLMFSVPSKVLTFI